MYLFNRLESNSIAKWAKVIPIFYEEKISNDLLSIGVKNVSEQRNFPTSFDAKAGNIQI